MLPGVERGQASCIGSTRVPILGVGSTVWGRAVSAVWEQRWGAARLASKQE